MAIAKGHPEFVRFVNGVLERIARRRTWAPAVPQVAGPCGDHAATAGALPGGPVTEREEAGARLTGLGAAHDRIATAMYTVDTHPAWHRLDRGRVAGETAMGVAPLRPEVDLLWACFGALGEYLERARAMLARPRFGGGVPPELTALLTGDAVGLDAGGMPVDDTATPVGRISLAELAERTERRSAVVLWPNSADVDTAATAMAARYVEASAEVDAVAALASSSVNPSWPHPLRAAAAEVERSTWATRWPPHRAAGSVRPRTSRLERPGFGRRGPPAPSLAELASVRDSYAQRPPRLAAMIDEVTAAEAGGGPGYAGSRREDRRPRPRAVAVRGRRPAGAADRPRRAARPGPGRRGAVAPPGRGHVHSGDIGPDGPGRGRPSWATSPTGLLARRAELRGRLEAYRAKAVARGLAEDARLAGLFAQAHDLLYTAPCDLRAATRAVHAYQTSLVDLSGPRREECRR